MPETFENWWADVLKEHNYAPDPDDPEHFYDYRAAFEAGHKIPKEGEHWGSQFKHELHEDRFLRGDHPDINKPDVDWWDTKYDTPAKNMDVILFDSIRKDYLRRLRNR
tara:strand:- start:475 stop:798 length:324 start_codon:yes stop_codon:yes gene_type:complete